VQGGDQVAVGEDLGHPEPARDIVALVAAGLFLQPDHGYSSMAKGKRQVSAC
jgi:hypothetical protein